MVTPDGADVHVWWRLETRCVEYDFVKLASRRFVETFEYYGFEPWLRMSFASPYLRHAPTELVVEEVVDETIESAGASARGGVRG